MATARHEGSLAAPATGAPVALPFYAVQFLFGGWFLFHGTNYWAHWFTQPPGASAGSHELISALIDTGLFSIVKAIEVVVAVALLANRLVPLAAVAAFPVTLVIAYDNLVVIHDVFGCVVGVTIILTNSLIALGHLERFLPMLAWRTEDPSLAGVKILLGRR